MTTKYRFLIYTIYLLATISLVAQQTIIPQRGIKKITSNKLYNNMSVLASPEFGGRAPGEPGGEKAATYIEKQFKKYGLKPYYGNTYRQEFLLYRKSREAVTMKSDEHTFSGNDQIFYMGNRSVNTSAEKELVYIGNANDTILSALDLKNKLVLVNLASLTRSYALINKLEAKGVWGVMGFSDYDSTQFRKTVSFNSRIQKLAGLGYKKPVEPETGIRLYILNNKVLQAFTGLTAAELSKKEINKDNLLVKTVSILSPIVINEIPTWNIAAVIKGSNPSAKAIAVTAHYDHIGQQGSGLCLGADDNASGVSAIMQVASAYKGLKKKPERDIIFIAFGAEELGLLGSEHFMKDYSKDDFFANINIDMIGRRDTATKDNYVYIIGTDKNPFTHNLHQNANRQTVNLNLDYAYNKTSGYGSMINLSDHYHFYKKNIPVIAFFSGLHDDYHTPGDTIEKIDFQLMTKRVQLVFATLYLLVNSESIEN